MAFDANQCVLSGKGVTRNLFRLSDAMGRENRFTASLHALLELLPSLGQAYTNAILEKAGKSSARYIRSCDHPTTGSWDQPDFLLQCESFVILFEHKIGAQFGDNQLKRYLSRVPEGSFLCVVTRDQVSVDDALASDARYLKPRAGTSNYFRWQDLYPVFEEYTGSQIEDALVSQFLEYIRILQMGRPTKWDQLWVDANEAEHFSYVWLKLREAYKGRAAVRKVDPQKRGFQIQRIRDPKWLRLLYVCVRGDVAVDNPDLPGPHLVARFYAEEGSAVVEKLESVREQVHWQGGNGVAAVMRGSRWKAKKVGNLVLAAEAYTSLGPFLSLGISDLGDVILQFVRAAERSVVEFAGGE